MAADCAVELKSSGVTMVSLWPGAVKTELVQEGVLGGKADPKHARAWYRAESVEFSGLAIRHLAADQKVAEKTGRILLTQDLALEYGFTDVDGEMPLCLRNVGLILAFLGYPWIASWIPDFVKIPLSLIHMRSNKF